MYICGKYICSKYIRICGIYIYIYICGKYNQLVDTCVANEYVADLYMWQTHIYIYMRQIHMWQIYIYIYIYICGAQYVANIYTYMWQIHMWHIYI